MVKDPTVEHPQQPISAFEAHANARNAIENIDAIYDQVMCTTGEFYHARPVINALYSELGDTRAATERPSRFDTEHFGGTTAYMADLSAVFVGNCYRDDQRVYPDEIAAMLSSTRMVNFGDRTKSLDVITRKMRLSALSEDDQDFSLYCNQVADAIEVMKQREQLRKAIKVGFAATAVTAIALVSRKIGK